MAQAASPPKHRYRALAGALPVAMPAAIEALVDSGGPSPRRLSVGLDRDRLAMMLALRVRIRMCSSTRWAACALPRGFIAFGEVGLAGEALPAPRGQERLNQD